MAPTLLVMGGNGFLGGHICRSAVTKGWKVLAVSRSGRPSAEAGRGPAWHDQVEWVKGDAFDPESLRQAMEQSDHVAHTIGILDYRGFLADARPSRVLDKLGSTLADAAAEVLPIGKPSPELGIYDRLNRDAAVQTIDLAKQCKGVKSFLYISAAAAFPGIPQRYITTKRQAEDYLFEQSAPAAHAKGQGDQDGSQVALRPIVFRPGFMYSEGSGYTKPVAHLIGLSYALNSGLGGRIPGIGGAGVKPLAVTRVGDAVVEACADENVRGVVEVHGIGALADARWRAEML